MGHTIHRIHRPGGFHRTPGRAADARERTKAAWRGRLDRLPRRAFQDLHTGLAPHLHRPVRAPILHIIPFGQSWLHRLLVLFSGVLTR